MFEQEIKVSKKKVVQQDPAMQMPEAAPKKLHIYKVITTIEQSPNKDNPIGQPIRHTDYVRAKTLAGAAKIVADRYVVASLATQEDLLALAKVAVIGEKAGA